MRIVDRARRGNFPVFVDGNRNGDGTVVGNVRLRRGSIDQWESRYVTVFMYLDNRRFVAFDGFLPKR
ncbi:MAG: hypothetical protein HRU19_29440 [Pseudobacteriovorax sp.]|nr:hypothetical protein [Pseudobacteriovorax sp.]